MSMFAVRLRMDAGLGPPWHGTCSADFSLCSKVPGMPGKRNAVIPGIRIGLLRSSGLGTFVPDAVALSRDTRVSVQPTIRRAP
jgi:hypothetical protein